MTASDPAPRLVYRVSELAAFLGWHEDTLRSEIASGRLVARKLRSTTVVLHADLLAYLDGLDVVPAAEQGPAPAPQIPTVTARGRRRVERLVSLVPSREAAL